MICPTCSLWFCTDDHDLDGMNAAIRNRAKVAKWQRENKEKVNAKQRRYYERLRQNGTMPSNGSSGISQIK